MVTNRASGNFPVKASFPEMWSFNSEPQWSRLSKEVVVVTHCVVLQWNALVHICTSWAPTLHWLSSSPTATLGGGTPSLTANTFLQLRVTEMKRASLSSALMQLGRGKAGTKTDSPATTSKFGTLSSLATPPFPTLCFTNICCPGCHRRANTASFYCFFHPLAETSNFIAENCFAVFPSPVSILDISVTPQQAG